MRRIFAQVRKELTQIVAGPAVGGYWHCLPPLILLVN